MVNVGRPRKYEEGAKPYSFTLSLPSRQLLKEIAEEKNLSSSEALDSIIISCARNNVQLATTRKELHIAKIINDELRTENKILKSKLAKKDEAVFKYEKISLEFEIKDLFLSFENTIFSQKSAAKFRADQLKEYLNKAMKVNLDEKMISKLTDALTFLYDCILTDFCNGEQIYYNFRAYLNNNCIKPSKIKVMLPKTKEIIYEPYEKEITESISQTETKPIQNIELVETPELKPIVDETYNDLYAFAEELEKEELVETIYSSEKTSEENQQTEDTNSRDTTPCVSHLKGKSNSCSIELDMYHTNFVASSNYFQGHERRKGTNDDLDNENIIYVKNPYNFLSVQKDHPTLFLTEISEFPNRHNSQKLKHNSNEVLT